MQLNKETIDMKINKKLIGIIAIVILLFSSVQIVSVYAMPDGSVCSISVDFTYSPESPLCTDVVHFTDLSTVLGSSCTHDFGILSYWWDFGDGYYSDLQNPVHCYYMNGSFEVTLTVKDTDNVSRWTQKTIHVGQVLLPDIKMIITVNANIINPGDIVNYTYEVINTGNCPLKNVFVEDDQGLIPVYVSGDDNNDSWLDIDEIWIYSAYNALYEDTANIGSVTAEDELGRMVYDEDDEFVDVDVLDPRPDVRVKKFVKEDENSTYSDEGITVDGTGGYVIFKIEATNTGNIPLDLEVGDLLPIELIFENYATVDGVPFDPVVEKENDYIIYTYLLDDVDPGQTVTIIFRATVSEPGLHHNYVRVFGTSEQCSSPIITKDFAFVEVKHDIIPPVTTCDIEGDSGLDGWFKSEVDVKLSATDDQSGVSQIFYRIELVAPFVISDGGSFIPVDGDEAVFTLNGNGCYKISYYAVDNAGNIESSKSTSVKIDKTLPIIKCDFSGDIENDWFTSSVTVSISAKDIISGVISIEYFVEAMDENGDLLCCKIPYTSVSGLSLIHI